MSDQENTAQVIEQHNDTIVALAHDLEKNSRISTPVHTKTKFVHAKQQQQQQQHKSRDSEGESEVEHLQNEFQHCLNEANLIMHPKRDSRNSSHSNSATNSHSNSSSSISGRNHGSRHSSRNTEDSNHHIRIQEVKNEEGITRSYSNDNNSVCNSNSNSNSSSRTYLGTPERGIMKNTSDSSLDSSGVSSPLEFKPKMRDPQRAYHTHRAFEVYESPKNSGDTSPSVGTGLSRSSSSSCDNIHGALGRDDSATPQQDSELYAVSTFHTEKNIAEANLDGFGPAGFTRESKRTKSHAQLSETAHGVRLLSKDIFNTKMRLEVENLMIVTKHYDDSLIYLTRDLVEHIFLNYPHITIYLEKSMFHENELFKLEDICKDCSAYKSDGQRTHPQSYAQRVQYWDLPFIQENDEIFDLVITLGGDGTVLYVSNLFQRNVPPVMSFALGSLGFLTNFKFEKHLNSLKKILKQKVRTKMRMRLSCTLYRKGGSKILERQVLNELTIDRGPSPFISNLELYGDDYLLTVAQADGLIIATPTGSTAYSLSAGGSLVYPSVNALVVTPICAHTLSFRPIILPDSMVLKVKVPQDSRSTAWAAFDGKNREELEKGDYIVIKASPYSFPTLEARSTEFIDSISRSLNWNQREPQKSFSHMLSDKNKSRYEDDVMKNKIKYKCGNSRFPSGKLAGKHRSSDLEETCTDSSDEPDSDNDEEDLSSGSDYACV